MADRLRLEILPEVQLNLFESLSSQSFIKDFYLAGGTCLALQIGHRQSVDFDFFIPADFDTSSIINILTQIGSYQRDNEERNTINGSLNDVRISFFGYKYGIIDDFINYNNIRLAGMKDIAAMKLEAIAGRGSKKDFIDLFFLLQQFTLEEIFSFHTQKYGVGLSNQYHHLKSLVYFADAESEATPVMIKPIHWDVVKKHITAVTKHFKLQ
jgi:predicted nucleotidyltransferase component of viral defense system